MEKLHMEEKLHIYGEKYEDCCYELVLEHNGTKNFLWMGIWKLE